MINIINNNKKYTFIPNNDWFNKIIKNNIVIKNDIYEKFDASLQQINGEFIICNDISKTDNFEKKLKFETYQEYLEFINKRDNSKDNWIYNIIDGISEQKNILFQDELCIIVPNYTWNNKNLEKMYILSMPKDKNIKSLRSLNSSHINLLLHIKNKTLEIIKKIYNYDENIIKIFIHYPPSTYHLHVHFVLITNNDCNSSVEYSHELNNVIFNLQIKNNYYQEIKLLSKN